jgi:hypothetical protein
VGWYKKIAVTRICGRSDFSFQTTRDPLAHAT